MQKEKKSLHKNVTGNLMKLPKQKNAIHHKCVLKRKEDTSGVEDAKYKARLVVKGYSQISGIDFTRVFSPIIKLSSIRALLGIVAKYDLDLEPLNVKIVFLHGELLEDISQRVS